MAQNSQKEHFFSALDVSRPYKMNYAGPNFSPFWRVLHK